MLLYLNICVPVAGAMGLEVAVESLARLNQVYLRTHPHTPPLYRSGVVYLRDADLGTQDTPATELWVTIPDCRRLGGADCKVLAAWRIAELREGGDTAARCLLSRNGHLWHVRVRRGDGSIEDPSARLGMKGAA